MKTLIIDQKMSGTGSIHDLASQHYDREIKFRGSNKYAVVAASYYGDIQSSHATQKSAIKASKALGDYSHKIIDTDGNTYSIYGDTLQPV
ncbi:MAG: hypothetical protein OEV66_12045 [Spirochaetia bacterium]|nr:hypothetical protein [Spirochaetia bacterium]